MADITINGLTPGTISGSDEIEYQVAGGGASRKTTAASIAALAGSASSPSAISQGFIDPTTTDGDLLIRKSTVVTALVVGFIGDSITDGTTLSGGAKPGTIAASSLSRGAVTVTSSNQGVSGATSADWVSGSSNLNTAKTAFASAGVRLVNIMLGTNDSKTSVATTQAQYRANLLSLCGDLLASGFVPVVSYPPFLNTTSGVFDAASPGRILSYLTAIDSLVDGARIFQGDTSSYAYFQANTSALQSDGVHPTQAGSDYLGGLWAKAMGKLTNALTNRTTLQRATLGAGLTYSGGVISASGSALGLQETIRVPFTSVAANTKRYVSVPRSLQINGWTILADVSGSLVVDIYSDLFANYPPNNTKSICASAKPTLSSSSKAKDSTLTGWTATIPDDSALIVNVDSVTAVGAFELALYCTKLVGGPPTVTWSPSDKEANFTLSSGNLVVTRGGGSNTWGGIRGTVSRDAATANHYFELVAGSNQQMVGVALSTANITSSHFIGDDSSGWSHYASAATKINGGTQTAYGTSWTSGDVIGVLLKNGKLYFRKNGTWMNSADPIAETGFAFSGLTGNMYPAHSLFTNGDTSTARFSASSVTGSLPSGTSTWGA